MNGLQEHPKLREYEQLDGMHLDYLSGQLQASADALSLQFALRFRLRLDFERFRKAANRYIPGYLSVPENAIRPELQNLAYHYSYNYLGEAPGFIDSNASLFGLFTGRYNYQDGQWSSNPDGIERMYRAPAFALQGEDLVIDASLAFRRGDGHPIATGDLPVLGFQWALLIMLGHDRRLSDAADPDAPAGVATLGYYQPQLVDVGGVQLGKGMLYLVGAELALGDIPPSQVRVAGVGFEAGRAPARAGRADGLPSHKTQL